MPAQTIDGDCRSHSLACAAPAHGGTTKIAIDATAGQHKISPLIYGVAFASTADLKALNAPLAAPAATA